LSISVSPSNQHSCASASIIIPSPLHNSSPSQAYTNQAQKSADPLKHPTIMAAILGGDNGIADMGGGFPLEQWFFEMPPCTRYWTTATVITAILTQCKVLTPFQLYYSFRAVWVKSQVR
jgi:Der1-like family